MDTMLNCTVFFEGDGVGGGNVYILCVTKDMKFLL